MKKKVRIKVKKRKYIVLDGIAVKVKHIHKQAHYLTHQAG